MEATPPTKDKGTHDNLPPRPSSERQAFGVMGGRTGCSCSRTSTPGEGSNAATLGMGEPQVVRGALRSS
jgi:hypothetical protein